MYGKQDAARQSLSLEQQRSASVYTILGLDTWASTWADSIMLTNFFGEQLESVTASVCRSLTTNEQLYQGRPYFMGAFSFFSSSSTMLVRVRPRVRLHTMAVTFGIFVLHLPVRAYVPAIPTNDTAVAIANGLNVTETSRLNIEWGSLR